MVTTAKKKINRRPHLNEKWTSLHRKRPQHLFHYTNAHGLLGIFQSKRIWATNSRFMNDPTEIEYAVNLIKTVMQANFSRDKKEFLNKALHEFLREYEQNAKVYIACFCVHGDLLSQWRGYGATGGGYALGFKTSQLGYPDVGAFGIPRPILRKVIYDRKIQEDLVRTWLNEMAVFERSSGKKFTARKEEELNNHLYGTYGYFLSEFLNCFKDPAYQEEQEWRIIQFGRRGYEAVINPTFRTAGGCIVPYTEINFKPSKKFAGILPVELIYYGPTLNTHITERSLNLLCESHGFQKDLLKIARSTVPFTT